MINRIFRRLRIQDVGERDIPCNSKAWLQRSQMDSALPCVNARDQKPYLPALALLFDQVLVTPYPRGRTTKIVTLLA